MERKDNSKITNFEGKYLTFNLIDENYGISVDWIMQIIAIPGITQIPQTPAFVKGVINLRGKIIPVIDLRLRFKLQEREYDDRTSIVIIKINNDNQEIFIGLIVDKVLEVLDIHEHEIEAAPTFGIEVNTEFILAMAKVKGIVATLLDISKIFTASELAKIK